MKVMLETSTSRYLLTFHFEQPFGSRGEEFPLPLTDEDDEELEKIGEIGASLIRRLADITALEDVSVPTRHSVTADLGRLFDWTSVLPQVLDAIRAAFNVCELEISYHRPIHAHFMPPSDLSLPEIES